MSKLLKEIWSFLTWDMKTVVIKELQKSCNNYHEMIQEKSKENDILNKHCAELIESNMSLGSMLLVQERHIQTIEYIHNTQLTAKNKLIRHLENELSYYKRLVATRDIKINSFYNRGPEDD